MLEIQERFDTVGYDELKKAAGNAELHITEALDKGDVIGFIAYSYGTDRTVVYDYDDGGDMMLCDGLVRSVMLKSAMKGIETMIFELPDTSKLAPLVKLRFLASGSNVCENIDGFMNACEHCKNQ